VVVVDVNGYDERQWSESEQDRAVLGIVAQRREPDPGEFIESPASGDPGTPASRR